MPAYRVYFLETDGHVKAPPKTIDCANDDAAIMEACQFLDDKIIEVWEGARFNSHTCEKSQNHIGRLVHATRSGLTHVNAAFQHICLVMITRASGAAPVKTSIKKRSVVVGGHKTSASLETEFWEALREIAQSRQMTLSTLLATIKARPREGGFSSAIRVFVLNHYRKK